MVMEEQLTKIKLGLVPEHFSCPIYMSNRGTINLFNEFGIDLEVINCPAGTGDMINKLKEGIIDVAIIVTEGFVSAKLKGDKNLKAIGTYVESPLRWSVSTGFNRDFSNVETLPSPLSIGISRLGSGSHVMGQYLINSMNKSNDDVTYSIEHDINGLTQSVIDGKSDCFLWEHFTTKPLYDNQILKKLGDVIAPWPSFLSTTYNNNNVKLNNLNQAIQLAIKNFLNNPIQSKQFIMDKFNYNQIDVNNWFDNVKYPNKVENISNEKLKGCIKALNGDNNKDNNNNNELKDWIIDEVGKLV